VLQDIGSEPGESPSEAAYLQVRKRTRRETSQPAGKKIIGNIIGFLNQSIIPLAIVKIT